MSDVRQAAGSVGDGPHGAHPELEVDHVTVVEKGPLKKAISGATMGNLMEWYDFGIYGYLAATMTKVFQPENTDQNTGMIITYAVFAVSFLARPFGGMFFGPLGDKIGRQKTLAITMIAMSLGTGLIGLLPSFATAGWWAFAALIVLKMVQGFSTGGEYSGATTFVAEYSPDKKRGYLASFLDTGSYLGFAIGAAVVAALSFAVGDDAMLDWGWRVPFLLAIPFGLLALWFRMKIEESPTFESTQAANAAAEKHDEIDESQTQLGLIGIVKHHWRPLLIAMALVGATNTAGYSLTSYMPGYLESNHDYTTLGAATATIPALIALSLAVPFVGKLSDKIGRKPVYWIAIISTLVFTYPAYLMMENKSLVWLSMLMLAFSVTFYVAMSASTLPALFPTASRFGGMALSYNIAVSLFGGTAPTISESLVKLTGSKASPALYTMFFAVLGGIALIGMKESARRPLPGSMPTVGSEEEAKELVETQHDNPDLDHDELPFHAHDVANAEADGEDLGDGKKLAGV